MKRFQDEVIEALEKVAAEEGQDCRVAFDWANTGLMSFGPLTMPITTIAFDFQTENATLAFDTPAKSIMVAPREKKFWFGMADPTGLRDALAALRLKLQKAQVPA